MTHPLQLTPEEQAYQTIKGYLQAHRFRIVQMLPGNRSPNQLKLDDGDIGPAFTSDRGPAVDALVDVLMRALHYRDHDRAMVRNAAARAVEETRPTPLNPNPASGQRGQPPSQPPAPGYSLSYAFVPVTGHVNLGTGAASADGPQHQLAFTGTINLHPDVRGRAMPGLELSWTVQVAGSGSDFTVQNVLQGLQAAWVVPFLNGALQVQALATALAGMARGGNNARGEVTLTPTTQIGAGGQVIYSIPGTGGHVAIGFQVAASVTAAQGSSPTADLSPQAIIQIQWN